MRQKPKHDDVLSEKLEASALIYLDIRGFTRCLDDLESSEDADALLTGYFNAWGTFRNLLIRPRELTFRRDYYLANRIGDAFVVFAFVDRPSSWFVFVTDYLQKIFDEFQERVRSFYPSLDTHLKIVIYSAADGVVPYYQTNPIPDDILGKQTIARRDFISSGINICSRIDGLDESDHFQFLCNRPVYERLSAEYAAFPAGERFVDLGPRQLRGVRRTEHIFGYRAP